MPSTYNHTLLSLGWLVCIYNIIFTIHKAEMNEEWKYIFLNLYYILFIAI